MHSNIILISGAPCTGKTTLAKKLIRKFNFPLISKDQIREVLFDNFDYLDQINYKGISTANYALMELFATSIVSAGDSFIMETVFNEKLNNRLRELKKEYKANIIEVNLYAEPEILYERFEKRASKDRHEGHGDLKRLKEWKKTLHATSQDPTDLYDHLIRMDVSHFRGAMHTTILEFIESKLA